MYVHLYYNVALAGKYEMYAAIHLQFATRRAAALSPRHLAFITIPYLHLCKSRWFFQFLLFRVRIHTFSSIPYRTCTSIKVYNATYEYVRGNVNVSLSIFPSAPLPHHSLSRKYKLLLANDVN